ncbi:MAG: hypothetical protein MJ063_00750 [Lachnospiraceae bacterium]|nr:hypothetical protein [Lachnospiraceae bacterium]
MTKIPKSPHANGNASTTNPRTWGTYEQAKAAVSKYGYTGVGIVLTDGLCGIDIDGNRQTGEDNPLAKDVLKMFDKTYIEHSPSKTGYHILCRCDAEKLPISRSPDGTPVVDENGNFKLEGYYLKNAKKELEIYPDSITNRFFTFTEDAMNDNEIIDMTPEVKSFLDRYMKKETVEEDDSNLKMNVVIKKAREHSLKFRQLYDDGDTSAYDHDESRADLALCSMLAYWFSKDRALIEQAFNHSALCRDKWTSRADYRENTITKACEDVICPYEAYMVPDGRERPPLKMEIFESYLDDKGISIRKNVITHAVEVTGMPKIFDQETLQENLATIFSDDLKEKFKGSTVGAIDNYLNVIAGKNTVNPVTEKLYSTPKWDGTDRISELFEIMRIPESDTLSRILVHKWLLGALALTYNTVEHPYGSDGVLVLQGKQGIGKSSLVSKLGIDATLCKTGLYIDTRDKDTIIRCTSCWIAELGEIGCTMKSDIDRLKAFLTDACDNYRVPYGRADRRIARRTSFVATTNEERFLIDGTGSRRFWTVYCPEKFDLEALNRFDVLQLWKQIEEELNPQDFSTEYNSEFQNKFRLTDNVRELLEQRNASHLKLVKGQAEVIDIFNYAEEHPSMFVWYRTTVSDFQENYECLKKYDTATLGKALTACNVVSFKERVDGMPSSVRKLPIPIERANNLIESDIF